VTTSQTCSARAYTNLAQTEHIRLHELNRRVEPAAALMCEPAYFEVRDSKNAFMQGNVGRVDHDLAKQQWNAVKATFERCGYPVHTVEPVAGLEDMVFAANQVLPGIDSSAQPYVVAGQMAFASRQREVPYYLSWFERNGYKILTLPEVDGKIPTFEGQGDAIWHPSRELLWIAFGNRTQESACDAVSELLSVPVLKLKLATKTFYHLDTAFSALDEETVMIYPAAFENEGLELIRHFFTNVIELTEKDAYNFAGNAVALRDKRVLLQKGSAEACRQLREAGFEPIELNSSEFMKSGGSLFCIKMLVY